MGRIFLNPKEPKKSVAEWAERETSTPKVAGSNPAQLTRLLKILKKTSEPGGIRTCDLRRESITRCPLGHAGYGILL